MFKVVGQQSASSLTGGNYVVTATPGGDYVTFLEYTSTDYFTTYASNNTIKNNVIAPFGTMTNYGIYLRTSSVWFKK